ncbi:MAG: transglycosylase SLT domain-containing protein [Rudaea sp.]
MIVLSACAGPTTARRDAAPPSAVAALYTRLDADAARYGTARESAGRGNAEQSAADATAALDDLKSAAAQCASMPGCDGSRFVATFDRLLRIPVTSAPPQGDTASAPPDGAPEPGESSPIAAALPETTRSVAILHGRNMSDIIALNDPVKVALEQWLTQYRPNLMKAYENYQYMRYRMGPEYEKAGLPEAILFGILAQESGGKVHAVSRSGASGPLQFMYATGSRFGLGVVDGFDQRFDPALSARANAAYMNEQLGVFNDNLELALAAYNGGEGAMQRLAARQPDASFWNPRFYAALSPATRDYVPMVLAAAWLYLHPERYHLVFPKLSTKGATIALKQSMSLDELTICLGQNGNDDGWFRTLRNLNPAVDPRQTLAAGTHVEVPTIVAVDYEKFCTGGKWVQLASELHSAALPPVAAVAAAPRNYIVKRGETLASIARKNGCASSEQLARANNIKPHKPLKAGQDLRLAGCSR